jgi:hypothetical protein
MPTTAPGKAVGVVIVPLVDEAIAIVIDAVADLRAVVLTCTALRGHAMHSRRQARILAGATGCDLALDAEHVGIDEHTARAAQRE